MTAHKPACKRLLAELSSPLVLILIGAAGISALAREWVDAAIVVVVVIGSALVGYLQERRADRAVEALRHRVRILARVERDGAVLSVPIEDVRPGDVAWLRAGSLIPGDGTLLDARDFFVNEAVLTGETLPVEKRVGDAAFLGTSARSGTARLRVDAVGRDTKFGHIEARLLAARTQTDFEAGLRRFGSLLSETVLVLVLVVFAANVITGEPPVDSLLFAVAIAVGIAPELLPAVVLVNLAQGAQAMAHGGVIVRRLAAIEDFGSMDVLCTDKTGTLTEGRVALVGAVDVAGQPSDEVRRLGAENAALQAGLPNALDDAIRALPLTVTATKVDEIPYDFTRKRLSVVVQRAQGRELITKGAVEAVLKVCTAVPDVADRVDAWCTSGLRVIAVASRAVPEAERYGTADERDLTLRGFLLFADPPKAGVREVLAALARLGVTTKVVSGDHRLVVGHLAHAVGLPADRVVTGREVDALSEDALLHVAASVGLFAEVDPDQKERIVRALRRGGHIVGYMGDGINDAPALRAANVGLSVEGAVDVAREAADFVLVDRDLEVLRRGILAGRTTFANTLKYVKVTESANLGNMLSMAAASIVLPFLPLLPKQVLLNNFLSDFPAMAIATDDVDDELLQRPHRWDVAAVRRFMIVFGTVSAVFDGFTFLVLRYAFDVSVDAFRTAWFVESLWTELVVALILRTRRPAWTSRPGTGLLVTSLAVGIVCLALPWAPGAHLLGFVPLPFPVLAALIGITVAYAATAEVVKRFAG